MNRIDESPDAQGRAYLAAREAAENERGADFTDPARRPFDRRQDRRRSGWIVEFHSGITGHRWLLNFKGRSRKLALAAYQKAIGNVCAGSVVRVKNPRGEIVSETIVTASEG